MRAAAPAAAAASSSKHDAAVAPALAAAKSRKKAISKQHERRSFQELAQAAHQAAAIAGDLVKARELIEAALEKPEASMTPAAHFMHGSICLQLRLQGRQRSKTNSANPLSQKSSVK